MIHLLINWYLFAVRRGEFNKHWINIQSVPSFNNQLVRIWNGLTHIFSHSIWLDSIHMRSKKHSLTKLYFKIYDRIVLNSTMNHKSVKQINITIFFFLNRSCYQHWFGKNPRIHKKKSFCRSDIDNRCGIKINQLKQYSY